MVILQTYSIDGHLVWTGVGDVVADVDVDLVRQPVHEQVVGDLPGLGHVGGGPHALRHVDHLVAWEGKERNRWYSETSNLDVV